MRVLTLNVCGIRASEKKGLFAWLKKQKSDYIIHNPQEILDMFYY